MGLTKRATVYFDPEIHRILKIKAAETSTTISEIINNTIKQELIEDQEDLQAFKERVSEPVITYEKLLNDLKKNGKI
ncbi:MAG: CopG family transcriptional regulator [Ignavibacteriales bacterium CG12_big_fil_rev_8_21_14_0_65_30_8]|nr:MAG: CopG family transcriptional regulator [Ignavibacteriales bacterium CG12_big_fil_rev_8_21_14_0_65_30_8]